MGAPAEGVAGKTLEGLWRNGARLEKVVEKEGDAIGK